jgi:hypothetical protein
MLVKLRATRIITRYSTASVIKRFFILEANQELTLRRLTTYIYIYIYTSYLAANLQTLHFIYLVNKYTYWIF